MGKRKAKRQSRRNSLGEKKESNRQKARWKSNFLKASFFNLVLRPAARAATTKIERAVKPET